MTVADFTAKDVKALRDRTGAGMMDAKRALEEANGDQDKAVEILRVKGAAKAEWELQLEAEEAAEKATTPAESDAEKPGITEGADAKGDEPGDLSHPTPKQA